MQKSFQGEKQNFQNGGSKKFKNVVKNSIKIKIFSLFACVIFPPNLYIRRLILHLIVISLFFSLFFFVREIDDKLFKKKQSVQINFSPTRRVVTVNFNGK